MKHTFLLLCVVFLAARTAVFAQDLECSGPMRNASPVEPLWLSRTMENDRDVRGSPALSPDGRTIYVAGSKQYVYALKAGDCKTDCGTLRWQFPFGGTDASPAVAPDGTVYVVSRSGTLHALNPGDDLEPAARLRWKVDTGSPANSHSSPALGRDGTVYVGTDGDILFAFDPNGVEKWQFEASDDIESSPAIGEDGTIYFGSRDGLVYALDPSGKQKWPPLTTVGSVLSSPAIGADGTVYVNSHGEMLYAIEPVTGQVVWTSPLRDGGVGYSRHSSPITAPDGTVYVAAYGRLYALVHDPESGRVDRRCVFDAGSTHIVATPALDSTGTIYVVTLSARTLYALAPDGTEKWRFKVRSNSTSSPAIGTDGTIYVSDRSTTTIAYALRSAAGPAASSWPLHRGNSQRTGRVDPDL